ncbi:MAG TPA: hypothetical protein VHZ26_11470 [Caulobacteraceae bacterium]|jgi:hypothetical protein|nr:hypothetical protein [Caulobacteraceae bacterium]
MTTHKHIIRKIGDEEGVERLRTALSQAVALKPGSSERARAVEMLSGVLNTSPRNFRRLLARYEAEHDLGLVRRAQTVAGVRRVRVSRAFDKKVPDPATRKRCSDELDQIGKDLWASAAAKKGSRQIALLAGTMLREHCEREGLDLPATSYVIPTKRVLTQRHYRIVDTANRDAKALSDLLPRIRRNHDCLCPMDVIVLDVKHLDLRFKREDGTTTYPKMIAFMDIGTGRVFAVPVLLAEGEGVRREHVHFAFRLMVAEWGLPSIVLIDRGPENSGLAGRGGAYSALASLRVPISRLNQSGAPIVISTRPYNPQSKPIEGWFGRFDDFSISTLPGYVGPDRLTKKSATQGRPATPYTGTFDELSRTIRDHNVAYNTQPNGGRAGRSPEGILQEHYDAGWRRTVIDPFQLKAAFWRLKRARIDKGVIEVGRVQYTHADIQACAFPWIEIAVSDQRGEAPHFRLPDGEWTEARLDRRFDFLDPAGRVETRKRQDALLKTIQRMKRDVRPVDVARLITQTRPTPLATPPPDDGPIFDRGTTNHALATALRRASSHGSGTASETEPRSIAEAQRLTRSQRLAHIKQQLSGWEEKHVHH